MTMQLIKALAAFLLLPVILLLIGLQAGALRAERWSDVRCDRLTRLAGRLLGREGKI